MVQNLVFNKKTEASIYLPDDTQPDKKAMEELQQLMELQTTIERLLQQPGYFSDENSRIEKMIFTPDFHKGAGIPIGTVMLTKGFVVPQAMGNDINCGMRVYTTDLTEDQIGSRLQELTGKIRHLFFEGGRDIPMTGRQRTAMFQNGLQGLLETSHDSAGKGIWQYYEKEEQEKELQKVAFQGSFFAEDTEGLTDFIGGFNQLSYDDQIGTIGGGNHFAEVQRVAEIYDGQTANAWNLKKGSILLMLHTGSLMIGHHSGMLNSKIYESCYPQGLEHPENKIYPLPQSEMAKDQWNRFWSVTNNAANFGFANRLFLGLMMKRSLTEIIGDFRMELLYDSPHNYIWRKEIDGEEYFLHRKGACSARGLEEMEDTPFAYYGEPVMIPGSMGSSSYLLRGMGNPEGLWSASHGAGRSLSRGAAIHGNDQLFQEFMKKFHIITPIDPNRNDLKGRRDILKKWEEGIRSEAPYAYKDIDQVVNVHKQHDLADLVARMEPVFTVKA